MARIILKKFVPSSLPPGYALYRLTKFGHVTYQLQFCGNAVREFTGLHEARRVTWSEYRKGKKQLETDGLDEETLARLRAAREEAQR